jgi:membrane-associated protease RseP (regulator of RpoE activity)
VAQAGGFLVKQVVKDSVAGQLGLKDGDRIGIVDGQHIVVWGDILLSVQGIPFASAEDRAKVLKALETLKAGDDCVSPSSATTRSWSSRRSSPASRFALTTRLNDRSCTTKVVLSAQDSPLIIRRGSRNTQFEGRQFQ